VPEERPPLPVPWKPAVAENKLLAAADLAIGLSSGAIGFARSLARPLFRPAAEVARRAEALAEQTGLREQARQISARGRRERVTVVSAATRGVLGLVPEVTGAVLDQLDLTSMVAERVDLNAIISDVDVDRVVDQIDIPEVASHVDVNAILEQIDIAGIVRYVMEQVDLPEIIRSSTGSITSESVRGMRMQSIAADERLGWIVDKALLRRRPRRTGTPDADGNAGSDGRYGPRA
jgi:hypothetical protein